MTAEPEIEQQIGWRHVLRSCSDETNRVARMWLYYTLFYWLIPTAIVLCGLLIARQPLKPMNLIIHGEFLIYAITLTASSTRLITKDLHKAEPFVNRQAFNLISHVMIFPAIFVYGLVRYLAATSVENGINEPLIIGYSVVLLAAAFYFSWVVFRIDAQRTKPGDVPKRAVQAIARSSDKLNADFDSLQAIPIATTDDQRTELERSFDALEEKK